MRKRHIFISLVSTFLLLGTGIGYLLYSPQKNMRTPDDSQSETHSYDVTWQTTSRTTSHMSGFASTDSDYVNTVSFGSPNLKEIRFTLNWTDDKATVLNRCGLDTLTLQITSPDGTTVRDFAKSAPKTKHGSVEITIPLKTERLEPLTLRSRDRSEAASQLRESYDDYTWVNKAFTVRVSVRVGEIRPLKRMVDRGNDFDLAITPVFYTASIMELASTAITTNNSQESMGSTNETSEPLTAQIKAGPLEGYPPLAVHFYGNPKNDTRIVSYQWEFGPTTAPIIPQSKYHETRVSLLLFFLCPFVYPIIYLLFFVHRARVNSEYVSTECDPTMVFLSTGNYWATLTVTDAQGHTASDTVWVTVLQYVYPDNDGTT